MADQSQSLTWVMAMLGTVLSSAALPWWQEERVPACQRKRFCGAPKSHPIPDLSVCAADCAAIYRHGHTLHNDRPQWKRLSLFHVSVGSLFLRVLLPALSVNLKIQPFFTWVTSLASLDQMQILVPCHSRPLWTLSPTPPLVVQPYTFLTFQAKLSSEYPMMDWPLESEWTTVTLGVFWPQSKKYISRNHSRTVLLSLPWHSDIWCCSSLKYIPDFYLHSSCYAVVESNFL